VYLSEEEAEGVEWIAAQERERLLEFGLRLPEKVVMSARKGTARKTATRRAERGELATDFPQHFEKTRCVFLDEQGRCGIQRLCMEDQLGDWYLKPLTCWIHPIVILPETSERSRPLITLVNAENDPQKTDAYPGFASCTHCGRAEESGAPAWQVLEKELRALGELAGRDLFGELSAPRLDY
jgi:G:T/U-mismatch repair DNA glycosylase